jgi:Na+/proline symporter
VIWTDVIQGTLLMAGCIVIFFALTLTEAAGPMITPELLWGDITAFFMQPDHWRMFISLIALTGFAAAVYPQAIQRIYAARNTKTLKRSYGLMLVMPLIISLPLFWIGISAADWFTDLSRQESESVVVLAIGVLMSQQPQLSLLLLLFFGAALAAIMSTADSALLTLGAMINKDIIGRYYRTWSERRLYFIGRTLSWLLIIAIAILAINLSQTIWALVVLKLELLIQVAPAIIIGVRYRQIGSRPLLAGLVVGCVLLIAMKTATAIGLPSLQTVWGIHAGIWALLANLVVVVAAHHWSAANRP